MLAERGHQQLRLAKRDEPAALTNGLANAIEEEGRTLHDTSAEYDGIGRKQVDEVGANSSPSAASSQIRLAVMPLRSGWSGGASA